jgi:protein-tyrosine phosphatase
MHLWVMSSVTWVAVGRGHLAVSSRLKLRAVESLARDGCTHVVTLLASKEHPMPIGDAVERAGMAWIWAPLENGNPPPKTRDAELGALMDRLRDALGAGGRVLVHCSAGIHRTGMIAYGLLRWVGIDAEAARAALADMRPVTAAGVKEVRLAWGDGLIRRW